MSKIILVVDAETRWARADYTLSKMTTEEYIRDPRFKAFGFGVKTYGHQDARWVSHADIPAWVASIDWANTALMAHNAMFDIAILSWLYGAKPAFIYDTLSMARALRGVEVGNSLAKLAQEYGLPPKGDAVHSTDGLTELPPEVETELSEYCLHDVFLCEAIFKRLMQEAPGGFPKSELRLIDMTIKMYTEPTLVLDAQVLQVALADEQTRRETLLKRLNVDDESLASNQKFAQILQSMGVTPPMKLSKTTGAQTLALAKNDALFQALLEGSNEDVALLCEARLAVKSTLERTRAQRFVDIARRGVTPVLPVPLSYYGAHTGRWTAAKGSAINLQNLKRGSVLRMSICAPEGSKLVVCDLSQIEPRVLAWLAGYDDMLDIFRAGGDPYATFGAQMFGIPGLNKKDNPQLRQSAKSALLGAGYGLGWSSFAAQLLTGFLGAPPVLYDRGFARILGITKADAQRFVDYAPNIERMELIPHTCSKQELLTHSLCAKKIIDKYRSAATPVVALWDFCNTLIPRALAGGQEVELNGLTFYKEGIALPNGLSLRYPQLRQFTEDGKTQWVYGDKLKRLYGGKVVENIVQSMARIVMTDGMLRIQKRYPVKLSVHDEALVVVPAHEAQEATVWMREQMIVEPKFMRGIPLDAEADNAVRYGDCK